MIISRITNLVDGGANITFDDMTEEDRDVFYHIGLNKAHETFDELIRTCDKDPLKIPTEEELVSLGLLEAIKSGVEKYGISSAS